MQEARPREPEQSIADLFTDRRTTLGYGVLAVLPLPIFLFLLIMMSSLDIKAVSGRRTLRRSKHVVSYYCLWLWSILLRGVSFKPASLLCS